METKITKIRTIRKRKGWTQTRLAERSGVSANYIALLERGKKTPSLKLLSRIAEALEVKVSSIFENDLQKDLEELKRQYNTQELSEAIKHFANGLK
jgi:transcriptional regulator with XRE-family HTH domain